MKSETAQGYERGIVLLPGAMSFREKFRFSNSRSDSIDSRNDLDSRFKSVG